MSFRCVAKLDQLWPGEMLGVAVGPVKVLLVNVDAEVHGYEDRCAHLGVLLSKGRLEGCTLTCFAHEWQYDVCSGRGVNPRTARLVHFPVRVEQDRIYVDVGLDVEGEAGRG